MALSKEDDGKDDREGSASEGTGPKSAGRAPRLRICTRDSQEDMVDTENDGYEGDNGGNLEERATKERKRGERPSELKAGTRG